MMLMTVMMILWIYSKAKINFYFSIRIDGINIHFKFYWNQEIQFTSESMFIRVAVFFGLSSAAFFSLFKSVFFFVFSGFHAHKSVLCGTMIVILLLRMIVAYKIISAIIFYTYGWFKEIVCVKFLMGFVKLVLVWKWNWAEMKWSSTRRKWKQKKKQQPASNQTK